MHQIAHFSSKKFKNLTAQELLQVVNFFIEENKYNCTEDYICFEDFHNVRQKYGKPSREDVEFYFYSEYSTVEKLKDFYKKWR